MTYVLHFLRPNRTKKAGRWHTEMVLDQARFEGIAESDLDRQIENTLFSHVISREEDPSYEPIPLYVVEQVERLVKKYR